MNIKLVVFDLDGTLVSSHETIYEATVDTLRRMNIPGEMPREKFYGKIGLHFVDIFNDFNISVPDFEEFIGIYKSVYFDFIQSSSVYNGVQSTIDFLASKGIKISLLTTKAQEQAELILKHFDLYDKFDEVMGRRPGMAHKPSPEPLLKICEFMKIDASETLVVGDSEMDIQCGKNAGSKTCAVTYGYRTKEELQKSEPDFMVDNIIDIVYIVDRMDNDIRKGGIYGTQR